MYYRAAELADAEAIARLHTESWRRTYRGNFPDHFLDGDLLSNRLEVWQERLGRSPNQQFVCVATDGASLAGFLCVYGGDDPEWGSLVDNLHVANLHSGKGVGSNLMRQAGSWLSSSYGHCGVYLWGWEVNETARRFYERLGAANAGALQVVHNSGATSRNCRYVWPSPDGLAETGGS